jgi:hypothetical protein
MVDFPKFFASAGELYNIWPSLFIGAVPGFFGLLGIVATWSWRARAHRAALAEAGLRVEMAGL